MWWAYRPPGWARPRAAPGPAADRVDFNQQIRPIFAEACYACHGPDTTKRKAKLRLDSRQNVFADRDGTRLIVPGKSAESALYRRLTTGDDDDRMPPDDAEKTLTPAQIELIRRWIDEGASWQKHWAYARLVRPALPSIQEASFVRNAIDRFVLAKLEAQGLRPSAEADRATLIRRLHFDITGLPPTPAEVEAFVADARPRAYEKRVDRLLASPHFGERMAMHWLDLVRFADTVGYHGDQSYSVWPFRDYVIDAFNRNMPYDQFTIEQLGGDLLPDATRSRKVASGYNRLNMITAEGGAQDKEYLAKYAADRVRTTQATSKHGTILKIQEDGTIVASGACPDADTYTIPVPTELKGITALRLDVLPDEGLPGRGPGRADNGNFVLNRFALAADGKPVCWSVATASHSQKDWPVTGAIDTDAKSGWAILEQAGRANHAVFETRNDVGNGGATTLRFQLRQTNGAKHTIGRFRLQATVSPRPVRADGVLGLPVEIAAVFALGPNRRTNEQKQALAAYYRSVAPELEPVRQELAKRKAQKDQLEKSIPTMLVSVSVKPRVMRILPRGNWMDESGEVVRPSVPHFLPPSLAVEGRLTRLDLARWLVSRENPVTARVFVNRLWAQFFGTGLSKILNDVGTQGEPPSHGRLLDWLAAEFMESGWDIKHTIKVIVMSATYRQSSAGTAALRHRDPYNRLLARQSRIRLDAEIVRDNALAISGLLSRTMGGRSVKPYQPAGYYAQLNFPKRVYHADKGRDQYRRGVYTHWQRTFLHPSLLAFDAPTREECTAERARSNTPTQALVLLNDPTYVEAARVFAARIMQEGGSTVAGRIGWAYRTVLSHDVGGPARTVLTNLYERHLKQYRADAEAARSLTRVGHSPVPEDLDVAELAAWTSVARVMLNLHETITRP